MCSPHACSYRIIRMHRELDEIGLFVGNTVVLREQLIVLRQSLGQSSLCGMRRFYGIERVRKRSRYMRHLMYYAYFDNQVKLRLRSGHITREQRQRCSHRVTTHAYNKKLHSTFPLASFIALGVSFIQHTTASAEMSTTQFITI